MGNVDIFFYSEVNRIPRTIFQGYYPDTFVYVVMPNFCRQCINRSVAYPETLDGARQKKNTIFLLQVSN